MGDVTDSTSSHVTVLEPKTTSTSTRAPDTCHKWWAVVCAWTPVGHLTFCCPIEQLTDGSSSVTGLGLDSAAQDSETAKSGGLSDTRAPSVHLQCDIFKLGSVLP